jgi:hypothetical protein
MVAHIYNPSTPQAEMMERSRPAWDVAKTETDNKELILNIF